MIATGSWLEFGSNHALQVLVIEPLFEEANRCRRLVCDVMRGLDARGIGSRIAELPGTGESLVDIAAVRLDDWRRAIAEPGADFIASFRGGALIDETARNAAWRFAPETGIRVVRDLRRAGLAGDVDTLYAGHALKQAFLDELEAATPFPLTRLRTVRLESDPIEADRNVAGAPLWRRAEPGDDPVLAEILAEDLADWIWQCAAS